MVMKRFVRRHKEALKTIGASILIGGMVLILFAIWNIRMDQLGLMSEV